MIRKSTPYGHPEPTDDDFVTNTLFPLKTWEWHDGAQE